jgi:transmembrane sensor
VRYDGSQRFVVIHSGEVDFEVAHERRAFKVVAGPTEVVDLGTSFDIRRTTDATVVTVTAGHVSVAPSRSAGMPVRLSAAQQVTVTDGRWPPLPVSVDAERVTAWLHRQISFDHEPLARVAAEFNRYASKPIEITAPALRTLEVTGEFSTDDPEEFIAFLRSLEGVRVEVTATQIRVSQK